ncbi:MAG TPA: aminotransferase class V-fold PLP-dependent enzyme [Longimicrobiales bacterium]|nr:aminotransferase class V-fold PLP-dependent enzyme [Longimicrobiales bacterium]
MNPHQPLDCRREDFRVPADVHYLNCAFMGPLPGVAEEAGVRAIREKSTPWTVGPDDFFETSDTVRGHFASIVGGRADDVAIHPSVSYAVATAARNLPAPRGSRIVLLAEQFPGNVYAWHRLAAENDAELVTVPRPESSTPGAAWNEAVLDAIASKTSIVSLPNIHWTDGTIFDLTAIGSRARKVGAALVVDGTQSVGALPLDVDEVRPDLVVAAGYKWLLGPYSTALTWLGERFADGTPLEEGWIAREGSEDFQALVDYTDAYGPGRVRYDVGERSNFALLPVLDAALAYVAGLGADRIRDYCDDLSRPLLARARELGFGVEEDAYRARHLFGLRMPPGLDLKSLRDTLIARRIHVSLRGSALRVSPNVYNDAGDVAALVTALEEAVGA